MLTNDEIKNIFSMNLQRLMKEHDKTQTDLVRDLNLKRSTVSAWICCEAYPRMPKVKMLAEYFGVDMSEFVSQQVLRDGSVFVKRTTKLDERFNYFIEELHIRDASFTLDGMELTEEDLQTIETIFQSSLTMARSIIKSKHQ